MKVLYFDCSSGISGNMTLGALSELIDDPHYLENELKKLMWWVIIFISLKKRKMVLQERM